MTGGTTNLLGQSYGNGTYTVSGGGGWFGANWRVMDKVETTSTTNRNYVVNTGLPQGVAAVVTTATNGMSYTGAWINVAMPQAIFVASYSVTPAGDNAKGVSQWTLLGSADRGATWDHLDSRPYADMTAGQAMVRPVTTSRAYSLYRLVCQRAGNTNFSNFRDYCSIWEWRLFGAPPSRTSLQRIDNGFITNASLFNAPLTVAVQPPNGAAWTPQDWAARLSISALSF